MRVFLIIVSLICSGLIIYNITKVNFDTPFNGESLTALITIMALACALLLIFILLTSKQIEKKSKQKK